MSKILITHVNMSHILTGVYCRPATHGTCAAFYPSQHLYHVPVSHPTFPFRTIVIPSFSPFPRVIPSPRKKHTTREHGSFVGTGSAGRKRRKKITDVPFSSLDVGFYSQNSTTAPPPWSAIDYLALLKGVCDAHSHC